jgi:flagellar M-ring protein FliF
MNEQVQGLLRQLSLTQRIGIIGAALGSIAAIAILVMFASKPDYTAAFTGLSTTDASSLTTALRTANISYQLTDAGTTIMVPVDSLSDAKVAAAAAGVTTNGSAPKGMELFDNQGFGASAFDQNVTYQRALEGQLTGTIQAMAGIASARVAVVLMQVGAVSAQDTPASASVVITMNGGQAPSAGLVRAIVNTVAGSVQGLSAANVVVTDNNGHVLAGAADSADTAAAQAKDLVEQQATLKIQQLIDAALGPGHASVAVSADVNTSQVQQDVTTYAPAGSDPPVSIAHTIEAYGGSSSTNGCGIPGVTSNVAGVPSYPGLCGSATAAPTIDPSASPAASASPSASAGASPGASASAAPAGYIKESTTVNYSISQTVQHIVTQPGVVQKLSVAVLVDKTAMGTLTADTLKTSIEAAIGADTARGDVVAVNAVPFAKTSTATNTGTASSTGASAASSSGIVGQIGSMSGTILGAVFALVMLVLFWMNLGALRRRTEDGVMDLGSVPNTAAFMPASPGRPALASPAGAQPGAAELAADAPNATPQGRIQERLRMVADERPDALVGLMHGWLREEDRRR